MKIGETGPMKEVLDFLSDLRVHNDREWFESNRSRYEGARRKFLAFTEGLIAGIGSFDPEVRELTAKDCTYRIYRDIRFSANKDPYKTYMGAYVCRGGRKSGFAGYYFHLEPFDSEAKTGCFLVAGLYMPESDVVKSVREEIFEDGAGFVRDVGKAREFRFSFAGALRRIPAGYPADSPYADYLKMKDFCLECPLSEQEIASADLLERTVDRFRGARPFLMRLNRAVEYAYELRADR